MSLFLPRSRKQRPFGLPQTPFNPMTGKFLALGKEETGGFPVEVSARLDTLDGQIYEAYRIDKEFAPLSASEVIVDGAVYYVHSPESSEAEEVRESIIVRQLAYGNAPIPPGTLAIAFPFAGKYVLSADASGEETLSSVKHVVCVAVPVPVRVLQKQSTTDGLTYLACVLDENLEPTAHAIEVRQLYHASEETVPSGTVAMAFPWGKNYVMQVPVWL